MSVHIHAERVVLHRGHDLDVELVPLSWCEVRAIPVSEEGGDCSLLIGGLHARHELAVTELFVGRYGAAAEGGLGHADHGHHCCCKFAERHTVLLLKKFLL